MIFASGLQQPEGPVSLPDGSWLVVEMSPERGCVTQISADGKGRRVIAKTGRPNGLAIDRHGSIWVAESMKPSLLRVQMNGFVEEILRDCDGEPFLFPNDLDFGPDGDLYMTDSGILSADFAPGGQIRADYQDCAYDGRVYQINTATRAIRLVDRGIKFTNGIAFGPDHNLYVNETITGNVYRYRWSEAGCGPREYFGNVIDPLAAPGYKGPDGMKFGADGNLYVTVFGQQDVTVLDPCGQVVRRIRLFGPNPTNVVFGLRQKRIYITEHNLGNLESFDVDTEGLPLFTGAV